MSDVGRGREEGKKTKVKRKKKEGGKGPEEPETETGMPSERAAASDERAPACLAYSSDGKLLLAACGTDRVEVVSVAGGGVLFSLEGHRAAVTDIVLHPTNPAQAFTCCIDGSLRLWDLAEGASVKIWNVGMPMRHMLISADGGRAYVVVLKLKGGGGEGGEGGRAGKAKKCKSEGKVQSSVHEIVLDSSCNRRRMFRCRDVARLALAADGTLVAAAGRDVFVWRGWGREPLKLRHTRPVRSVAVHSEQRFIAAGDERGEIFRWFNALDPDARGDDEPVCSSGMHWHAHAVRAMCVSVEGAYLFSGGEEGVLVVWQLGTGESSFLPRLGGAIEALCVSQDGANVAVLCHGGKIKVVNVQTRKISKLHRLAQATAPGASRTIGGASVVCSCAGLVACGGKGSELEFWGVGGELVQHMEVTPRNHVSRTDQQELSSVAVKAAALASDGSALAVVHGREKGDLQCQLSMWRLVQGEWRVESRVLSPHKDTVTSVSFCPHDAGSKAPLLLLTTGTDGLFKVWRREIKPVAPSVHGKKREEREWAWRCSAVCGLRPQPCHVGAFGHDGSVLAAAYGNSVSVCECPSFGLITMLTHTSSRQPVERLLFVPQSTCLVAATSASLSVWDIATSTLKWSYCAPLVHLLAHPTLPQFTLCARSGVGGGGGGLHHVITCGVDSAAPLATYQLSGGGEGCLVWSKSGSVLHVLGAKGFVAVGGDGAEDQGREGKEAGGEGGEVSAYARMMAPQKPASDEERGAAVDLNGAPPVSGALAQLEGPSHVLAAPASLLKTFLTALLPRAPVHCEEGEGEGDKGQREGKGKKGKKKKGGDGEGEAGDVEMAEAEAADELSFEVPPTLDVFAK